MYFYQSGVDGHLFNQLRVGQRVAFEVAHNPGNPLDLRAVQIQTLAE